ncbi:MAG: GAF domain-containing sensor histidine kinase [Chloroflexota bacterium]
MTTYDPSQRQQIVELDDDLAEILSFLSSMLDNIVESEKFLSSVASTLQLLLGDSDVIVWRAFERGKDTIFLLSGCATNRKIDRLEEINILGSQNILEQVFVTRQLIYEPEYRLCDLFPWEDSSELISVMCAPILNNKKVIGLTLVLGERQNQYAENQVLGLLEQVKGMSMFLHNKNVLNHINTLFQDINYMIQEWIGDVSSRLIKVQQGEALLGKVLSDLSHEFKTPIASLRLYSGLITKKPEKSAQYLRIMQVEIARIEKLLEGILLLSEFRINSSNMEIRQHDLNSLLSQSLTRFKQSVGIEDPERIQLTVPNGVSVVVNENYFYFALEHLLNNSMQYSSESKIYVHASKVEMNESAYVSILVKDFGQGISPLDAPHIFSPFYRGEGVSQSAIFGAGLGLTYAKEIINSFGGALNLVDTGEVGTTMEMRLAEASQT